MQKLFNKCPACGGKVHITECQCEKCKLQLRGDFQSGPLATLSDDQLTFIRVFLSARGNLSEVERVLGISYPTIRNKLDEINDSLESLDEAAISNNGNSSAATPANVTPVIEMRKDILQKVADGQLSPTEAVQKLREVRGENK